jgi:hypothetical protein
MWACIQNLRSSVAVISSESIGNDPWKHAHLEGEVQESYPGNPLEDCCDGPWKNALFPGPSWKNLINAIKSCLLIAPWVSDWLKSFDSTR